jgi:hypothetical protein
MKNLKRFEKTIEGWGIHLSNKQIVKRAGQYQDEDDERKK